MKLEVIIADQSLNFIRRQSPAAQKRLRAAVHKLERGETFPVPLTDELDGFYKMSVENCRLILKHEAGGSAPRVKVVFDERPGGVYEMFRLVLYLE